MQNNLETDKCILVFVYFYCIQCSATSIFLKHDVFFLSIWLGASDAHEELDWRWTDGYLLTWSNWLETKPNGATSEDCLIRMTGGEWDDKDCSGSYQFYCETVTGICENT